MLDIDFFKKINDTYGHNMGDEVLKSVSKALKNNIRKNDIVGRIGGEEFLVIMPDITEDAIIAKAELLRTTIAELKWDNEDINITISGGVYLAAYKDTLDKILDQVDIQLYHSKNKGRNRISHSKV